MHSIMNLRFASLPKMKLGLGGVVNHRWYLPSFWPNSYLTVRYCFLVWVNRRPLGAIL